jgi:phosphoribosylamine--glycine ligase
LNVLVIGSGGREHALCWAIARSPALTRLYCAPGNGGIAGLADCVVVDAADHAAVVEFCRLARIDFVVVGPEAPLVDGLADTLEREHIGVFGPSAAAARLEGSKGFTKDLCTQFSIPTAAYGRFADAESARAYARAQGAPIVVKADGLAAGKGVTVAETLEEALGAIDACFEGAFGAAGAQVVVEEMLVGEEASFFALTDGETVLPLATAQDHKRVGDGDTGPNTGGMGAYSPAPVMTQALCARTMAEIVEPTVAGLASRGTPFRGVLYAGLMITEAGPKLIEYNVRFGDPECQVLAMRLKSDLLEALRATAERALEGVALDWHDDAALTVVMAADGYPGTYENGSVIGNLEAAGADAGVEIFHAGTARDAQGRIVAAGGRVLDVTARGRSVAEARARAYAAVAKIDWRQGFCRHDIGWRAVQREEQAERS